MKYENYTSMGKKRTLKLQKHEETKTKDKKEILEVAKTFYSTLYKSNTEQTEEQK